ncbi:MAG: phosphotransferase [Lachnospiraceae bacterium]|nr:phosphotransferase [Lachnospiraceae bacterium]
MMDKDFRELNIDGAPKIDEGASGEVYRIADDTIVKVYRPGVSLDTIKKEKELSKWAFVHGVPTAISFDIVRVEDRYGVVFELLNACSASDYINRSKSNLEDFLVKAADLMKIIHSIEVAPGELPDMKKLHLEWLERCRQYLSSDICSRLKTLVEEVPDSHMLLHGDFHLKNIMMSGDELMLIDMDTLCVGDPIFEISTIYNSYKEFPSISPEAAVFLGIDVDTADRIWERTLELYMGDADRAAVSDTVRRARLLGCIRIIAYMDINSEHPESKMCIDACVKDIACEAELKGIAGLPY